jgi:Tol biopolymer transport system component
LATNEVRQVTDAPGNDSWPAWSPDGSTIAFTSQRDDCRFAPATTECWRDQGGQDEHHDIWTIRPDGSGLRRVSPEHAQFVAWSPDGDYLLVSGQALYVLRPDGTGRLELRTPEIPRALGGIPDWTR